MRFQFSKCFEQNESPEAFIQAVEEKMEQSSPSNRRKPTPLIVNTESDEIERSPSPWHKDVSTEELLDDDSFDVKGRISLNEFSDAKKQILENNPHVVMTNHVTIQGGQITLLSNERPLSQKSSTEPLPCIEQNWSTSNFQSILERIEDLAKKQAEKDVEIAQVECELLRLRQQQKDLNQTMHQERHIAREYEEKKRNRLYRSRSPRRISPEPMSAHSISTRPSQWSSRKIARSPFGFRRQCPKLLNSQSFY